MSGNEREIKNFSPPQSWILFGELPPFSAGTRAIGPPQPMASLELPRMELPWLEPDLTLLRDYPTIVRETVLDGELAVPYTRNPL